MLTPLRIAAAIGLIFYFSPLRRPLDLPDVRSAIAPQRQPQAAAPEAPWALPGRAGQAVLEHLVANALGSGRSPAPEERPPGPRDTLEPEDLQPPWRGEGESRRADPRSGSSQRAVRGAGEKPRP